MSEERNDNRTQQADSWVGLILRLILSAIVIAIAAFLTPGFSINSIWAVLLAAIIISVVDYLIQRMTDFQASPFGRGFSGFIVSAIVLYGTQFLVPTMRVSVWGALIGALVIGIIDVIIPGKTL
ncbi:MAG: phage holin family protein [Candidatus Alkaliphilus sp. MAG34]|nr:phage holin family protein [Clostridiales bacterium]